MHLFLMLAPHLFVTSHLFTHHIFMDVFSLLLSHDRRCSYCSEVVATTHSTVVTKTTAF
jgi:hypothetical protein